MDNSVSRILKLLYLIVFSLSSAFVFDRSDYPQWGSALLAIGISLLVYWKVFKQKSLLTDQPTSTTGAASSYMLLQLCCMGLAVSDPIPIRFIVSFYASLHLYEQSKIWRKQGGTVSDAILFAAILCLMLLLCQRWLSAFFLPYCSLCAWHDLFKKRKQPEDEPIRQIAPDQHDHEQDISK